MQTDPRLFGIDLSRPWMQASMALREILSVCLRFLSPAPRVSLMREGQTEPTAKAARYSAIELPEHILLRRSLQMPPTTAEHMRAAVALDIQAHSPFEHDQALWTYQASQQNQRPCLEWALTTRALVETHLQEKQLNPQTVEVWVAFGSGRQPLPGFGEGSRLRHIRRHALLNGLLVLSALGLVAGIAVTPTAQLRFMALQANTTQHQLTQQAAPVLQQRERLMQLHSQATHIQQTIQSGLAVLPAMAALTQALPDDTVLRSLRLQGHNAYLSGQTANAADLMQHLGKQPAITEVRAPSAATRAPGTTKEQFELEFQLRPLIDPPPPEVPPSEPVQTDIPPPTAATAATQSSKP